MLYVIALIIYSIPYIIMKMVPVDAMIKIIKEMIAWGYEWKKISGYHKAYDRLHNRDRSHSIYAYHNNSAISERKKSKR